MDCLDTKSVSLPTILVMRLSMSTSFFVMRSSISGLNTEAIFIPSSLNWSKSCWSFPGHWSSDEKEAEETFLLFFENFNLQLTPIIRKLHHCSQYLQNLDSYPLLTKQNILPDTRGYSYKVRFHHSRQQDNRTLEHRVTVPLFSKNNAENRDGPVRI